MDSAGTPLATGSCFVASTDGSLVTNFHVISGASSAIVKFPNGAFFTVTGVLASDQEHDLAILQADGSDFEALRITDSGSVRVGQPVVAIGNPGELEYTVSNGIISAIRGDKENRRFQTTAPIAHGSSGGPLLNMTGDVIGVTSAMYVAAQNANFAVPSGYVLRLLKQLSPQPIPLQFAALVESQAPLTPPAASAASPPPASSPAEGTRRVWVSLQSAAEFNIWSDADYLYLEYRAAEGEPKFLCELRKQSKSYLGTCRWRYEASCPRGPVSCKLEQPATFRFITAARIEGTIDMPTVDCASECKVTNVSKRVFTLVQKQ
jgi:hypothetical protein